MGKLLVVVLAPLRFPVHVLQVFPGLPDNPAVLKAMVMLRQLSLSITWQSSFYFITGIAILTKEQNNQKSGPTFRGKVFRLWGMRMLRICGDVVLPKVTLNPIDSHKPMYYKVNNDHHGDLLPLGH